MPEAGGSLRHRLGAAYRCLFKDPQTSGRRELPSRRGAETIKFTFSDFTWYATVGRFDDGKLAEVFLSTAKSGNSLRALAEDAAIAASLALQHGCPAETLRSALTRDSRGEPATPLTAILDKVEGV